jgi:hypothetical protein
MHRPRRAMCVRRRLLPIIRAKVSKALDRSAAADALPLEAALLHLDTDFELHRPSHGPGDAAVSHPTTRRVVVVFLGSRRAASTVPARPSERQPGVLADRAVGG